MAKARRRVHRDSIRIPYPPTATDLAAAFSLDVATIRRSAELDKQPRVGREVRFTSESVERFCGDRGYTVAWIDRRTGEVLDPATGMLVAS